MAALVSHARELTDLEDRAVWLAARVAVATTCLLAIGLFLASLPARHRPRTSDDRAGTPG